MNSVLYTQIAAETFAIPVAQVTADHQQRVKRALTSASFGMLDADVTDALGDGGDIERLRAAMRSIRT
jgi:hypothetical protein